MKHSHFDTCNAEFWLRVKWRTRYIFVIVPQPILVGCALLWTKFIFFLHSKLAATAAPQVCTFGLH